MDGNRRFASNKGLNKWEGHRFGAKALEKLFDGIRKEKLNISEMTFYAFSMQNFNRSDKEKKEIFSLMERYFKEFFNKVKNGESFDDVKINFIGKINMFPKNIFDLMNEISDYTKNNLKNVLNFCVAYGGREEIIDAIKKINLDGVDFNSLSVDEFSKYLYLGDEPDFIIRTSGERRTSNFLIWQSYYSEWFFLDKMWPEFTVSDLKDCILNFENRERRFGK
jgi:tritrans,polycis-undecaprenyl-diphosphate synthase [geranylgeranyl-diphosphate specific]